MVLFSTSPEWWGTFLQTTILIRNLLSSSSRSLLRIWESEGTCGSPLLSYSCGQYFSMSCVSLCTVVGHCSLCFQFDLDSERVNPLTVIVIPLHEKEVRELCVNKKLVPLLMDPRNLFCHHRSKLCGQIKEMTVH